MFSVPESQQNHRYIDKKIKPWLDLHFPTDSAFNGRVVLCYRRKGTDGIYNLMRSDIAHLSEYVSQMHISRNLDYYITANSVCGVRRVTEDLFGLHNIVIDIDCHDEAANSTEILAGFIWRCARDLWNEGECPEPNSIVFSGRGVQLWWALEPASAKIQYWYKRMQAWLLDALEGVLGEYPEEFAELSLDRSASIRLAGLFRLPFTYNSKTGRKGSVQFLHKERYGLRQMLENYVPDEYNPRLSKPHDKPSWAVTEPTREVVKQEYVPLASRDSEVLRGGTTAMAARVQQLVRLRALRNASMGAEMRDRFCFTVYCALLADHEQEEAWRRLLAFNEGFKEPLAESTLRQTMSTASEKLYRLTNVWVIAELEIDEDEQEAIGLRPASGEVVIRRKRNHTRDMIRRTVREDRDNKILALFSEGVSKAQIARTLDLSWNTVSKVISAEEERRAAIEASQEAQEAQQPVAVGQSPAAAGSGTEKLNTGNASSNMVHNNIVFYGEAFSGLSASDRQSINHKGTDPPS